MITRTFAVGDLHGNYKALKQCLERCNFNFENDQLIVLGDICDGWSEFMECIELLSKVKNLIKIIGNHDVWALRYLEGSISPKSTDDDYWIWQMHGGKVTKRVFDTVPGSIDKFKDFFKDAKYYHIENNICYVHAGINLIAPIDTLPIYYYIFDPTLFSTCYDRAFKIDDHSDIPAVSIYDKIFVGHSATIKFENLKDKPFMYNFFRAIDTGAAYKNGKLTIMNVNSDEYWQSDFGAELYPDEKGR